MSTQVGKINVDYLLRPGGTAYEFINHLAANTIRAGEGCALGFYRRDRMEQTARVFLDRREAEPDEREEVKDWIAGLPWNENGCLWLAFNW